MMSEWILSAKCSRRIRL